MNQIHNKIVKYLKKQFPKKMILRVSKNEINPENEEIYGFMRMVISVYQVNGKIYYKLNQSK